MWCDALCPLRRRFLEARLHNQRFFCFVFLIKNSPCSISLAHRSGSFTGSGGAKGSSGSRKEAAGRREFPDSCVSLLMMSVELRRFEREPLFSPSPSVLARERERKKRERAALAGSLAPRPPSTPRCNESRPTSFLWLAVPFNFPPLTVRQDGFGNPDLGPRPPVRDRGRFTFVRWRPRCNRCVEKRGREKKNSR